MNGCTVKLYALSTCVHCSNARAYLEDCGILYECVEVDTLEGEERQQILEEVKRINPSCSFPTIIIGDRIIVGFMKDEIKEALHL